MDSTLRVLLISPLPKIDPACGDVTYTESLLANPPEGVEYETYADAMSRGTLVEHGTRRALKEAWARGDGRVGAALMTIGCKLLNLLRRSRWLFWEPYRFFSVVPGAYDLIHLHTFSARFLDLPCPLVVSNAARAPLPLL
jgi:hypothetical protein